MKQKKWICMIAVTTHIGNITRNLYCNIESYNPQLPDWSHRFGGYFGIHLLREDRPLVKITYLEDWLSTRKFVCLPPADLSGKEEHSLLMSAGLDEFFEIVYDENLSHPRIRYLAESV